MTPYNIEMQLINFFSDYKSADYNKGETIIRGDDEPTGVYFVRKGYVKMSSIYEDGAEITVNIFKPGSYFPMVWALGGVKNSYFYKAITPVTVYKTKKEVLMTFLEKNPKVFIDLTSRILVGLDGILSMSKNMLYSNSSRKVALTMAMLARRFGVSKPNGETEITLRVTHQDLASFSGLTRETVSLALDKFKRQGILTQKKRVFFVKSIKDLEQV